MCDPMADRVRQSIWTIAPTMLLALLVILQGGYYPVASSLAILGFAALVVARLIVTRNERRVSQSPLLIFAALFAAWLALSPALAGDASLNSIPAGASLLVALMAALYWVELTTGEQHAGIRAISYLGAACSIAGLLMLGGILSFPGGVLNGRLQFTFQYANSAGAFFAAMLLITCASFRGKQRLLALLPAACLVATRSVGALGIAGGAIAVMASRHMVLSKGRRKGALAGIAIVLAVAVGMAGLAAFDPARWTQALQTGIDRFIQMYDGLHAWLSAPLAGLGPDGWRTTYPLLQSAQYKANVIHCGYIQLLVSYGLVGAALAAGTICALPRSTKRAGAPQGMSPFVAHLAGAVLLVHAAVDIDTSYGALTALCAMAVCTGRTSLGAGANERGAGVSRAALPCTLGLCACVAVFGLYADAAQTKALSLIQQGRFQQFAVLFNDSKLLQNDTNVRTALYQTAQALEDGDTALDIARRQPLDTDSRGEMGLVSLRYAAGDQGPAERDLLDMLESQPHNIELFEQAAALIDRYGLSPNGWTRYETACNTADAMTETWPATLLRNQKDVVRAAH